MPRSGHIWESQVLLTDVQVVLRFRPPLMNDLLDMSNILERALKKTAIDLQSDQDRHVS